MISDKQGTLESRTQATGPILIMVQACLMIFTTSWQAYKCFSWTNKLQKYISWPSFSSYYFKLHKNENIIAKKCNVNDKLPQSVVWNTTWLSIVLEGFKSNLTLTVVSTMFLLHQYTVYIVNMFGYYTITKSLLDNSQALTLFISCWAAVH